MNSWDSIVLQRAYSSPILLEPETPGENRGRITPLLKWEDTQRALGCTEPPTDVASLRYPRLRLLLLPQPLPANPHPINMVACRLSGFCVHGPAVLYSPSTLHVQLSARETGALRRRSMCSC